MVLRGHWQNKSEILKHLYWHKKLTTKANAARKAAKATKDTAGGNNTKASGQKSPFKISDKLKAALCTEGQMSPDQFDRVCQNCEDF